MTVNRQLTVLGSTGSVGRSTLDVVSQCDNISVFALSAYRNSELLLSQCLQYEPQYAVLVDPEAFPEPAGLQFLTPRGGGWGRGRGVVG